MYTRTFVLFLIFILYTFIIIFAIMCEKMVYVLFQWIYRLTSKEVVKLLPVKFMFEAYPGLHDLDLYVAVRKVGEQCGLNVP